MNSVVLISGGMNSAIALAWTKRNLDGQLHAVTIRRGPDHPVHDLVAARELALKVGCASHDIVSVDVADARYRVQVSGHDGHEDERHHVGDELIMLGVALAKAGAVQAEDVVWGCTMRRVSRPARNTEMVSAMERAAFMAWPDGQIPPRIRAPLAFLTPGGIVKLANELPDCWDLLAHTRTCLDGPWCRSCAPCLRREASFREAGHVDPLTGPLVPR